MAKTNRLGKGLGALMQEEEELEESSYTPSVSSVHESAPASSSGESVSAPVVKVTASLPEGITADENGTLWVNPNLLKPNPRQPRQYFDEERLAELTESVRAEGILSPIIIEDAGDGSFYIIAGERRTRAARAAGLEKVPVQLRKYSDVRKLEVALVENIQRTDLNPIEEALAYYKLMELNGSTQEEVAKRVGKNRTTVANCVRLLKLPEDMQRSLASGEITSGHARALLSVISSADQRVLYGKIIGQGLSVRQTEQLAQEYNGGGRAAKKSDSGKAEAPARDPNYVAIEQKFIDVFGTKVKLNGNFDKGSIVIEYFSRDDLDRIYNIISPSNE